MISTLAHKARINEKKTRRKALQVDDKVDGTVNVDYKVNRVPRSKTMLVFGRVFFLSFIAYSKILYVPALVYITMIPSTYPSGAPYSQSPARL